MRQVKSLYMGSSESEKPMPTINDVLLLQGDASANVIMEWEQLGCRKADSGLWLTPAGQTCMTDQLATWVVDCLHLATHCGATLLVDALLQAWWHPRLKVLAAQTSARCLTCATHNPGKGVVCQTGRTPLPTANLKPCRCILLICLSVSVINMYLLLLMCFLDGLKPFQPLIALPLRWCLFYYGRLFLVSGFQTPSVRITALTSLPLSIKNCTDSWA